MIHTKKIHYDIKKLTLVNGCEVAYIDEGKGEETLLFIHGLATYGQTWKYQVEGLKDTYRCIAIDLPGNGYSGRGEYAYGINFFSGCIYDFIKKLGLKQVTLVGHSMGGQIAINLLANEPTIAHKLVLCATAGFETFTGMERTMYQSSISFMDMFSTDENSLRTTIRTSFYQYPVQADDMVEELLSIMRGHTARSYRAMVEACVKGMLNEPVYDKLKLVQQPALVLYGEQDALIPNRLIHMTNTKDLAAKGTKLLPKGQVKMIPRCGHFLQLEKADEVNKAIRQFMAL